MKTTKKGLHKKWNTFFLQIHVNTKKSLHQKSNTFFPRILVETCTQMHTTVKLLGGMQMWTILILLGEIQSNYWGDISPHTSQVSAPLCVTYLHGTYMLVLVRTFKQRTNVPYSCLHKKRVPYRIYAPYRAAILANGFLL